MSASLRPSHNLNSERARTLISLAEKSQWAWRLYDEFLRKRAKTRYRHMGSLLIYPLGNRLLTSSDNDKESFAHKIYYNSSQGEQFLRISVWVQSSQNPAVYILYIYQINVQSPYLSNTALYLLTNIRLRLPLGSMRRFPNLLRPKEILLRSKRGKNLNKNASIRISFSVSSKMIL